MGLLSRWFAGCRCPVGSARGGGNFVFGNERVDPHGRIVFLAEARIFQLTIVLDAVVLGASKPFNLPAVRQVRIIIPANIAAQGQHTLAD